MSRHPRLREPAQEPDGQGLTRYLSASAPQPKIVTDRRSPALRRIQMKDGTLSHAMTIAHAEDVLLQLQLLRR